MLRSLSTHLQKENKSDNEIELDDWATKSRALSSNAGKNSNGSEISLKYLLRVFPFLEL